MSLESSADKISSVRLSQVLLPLNSSVSDAKVLTGRHRPLKDVALLFAEIESALGHSGVGFTYALRIGGKGQYAHACEIAPEILGEDPNDIAGIWNKLMWASSSVGRTGMAVQAIAAFDTALWDLKAKRAGLPLNKLIGSFRDSVPCYNTSGGYLQAPIEEVLDRARQSLERGIQGIKLKVGQPEFSQDQRRVETLRKELGDRVPIMIDANQQWDRVTALRFGRSVEEFDLVWIEEPVSAHDWEGHAMLAGALDTPIASGEMLSSIMEHRTFIDGRAVDILQPDAPRIGGITPFLHVANLTDQAGLGLAPHFVMEIHIHLAACYPQETWVEHFEWLEPLFEERIQIREGRMAVPQGMGLGLTLSERMRHYTQEVMDFSL